MRRGLAADAWARQLPLPLHLPAKLKCDACFWMVLLPKNSSRGVGGRGAWGGRRPDGSHLVIINPRLLVAP